MHSKQFALTPRPLEMPFLIILLLIAPTSSAKESKFQNLNISLTQKVDNEGFHRELKWLLERGPTTFDCKLAIQLNVGPEMYLNPDQIADLNRLRHLSVLIDGEVDIETPAHLSTRHIAYIYVPPFEERVSLNIPFHLRYQRAQISGGYGKVIVNKPSVLALCPQSCARSEVKAPCDISNRILCKWNNVSYQALFDEVELLVPVGDLDDYPLVSIVTLLLGCAGCIYTLSVLSTTPL
ncbi:phosphatidylinositol-glycan biosynthesis class X protein-like [Tribolium madens]|uniref:phosphatidylinositol-glycan biosynthesis class X protein-like n=1 Tax=Tribolium madens TaxID=41895 RepID=UPI001CF74A86|nr:phosphatidylinositol-glycan biosynthesis class X protein-like [Tribolium madens]XP_044254705.1 phosphatidylinositol-glycan biosynthesis class X protein-like [Tribolium madens]XP_044254706.1 phosphatidylinositol-glycan biosynthesis class X protein-like [Tribolium madens]